MTAYSRDSLNLVVRTCSWRYLRWQENRGDQFLVQYKFTGNPAAYPISWGKVVEVVATLKTVARQFSNSQTLHWLLISNAAMGPTTSSRYESCRAGTVSELVANADITQAEANDVGHLQFVTRSLDLWERDIEKELKRYGVLHFEFKDCIHRCVGALVVRGTPAGAQPFSRSELMESLVGYPQPRRITPEDVFSERKAALDELAVNCSQTNKIYPTTAVEEIVQAIGAHLVIVEGDGGHGKTAALIGALQQVSTSCMAHYVCGERAVSLGEDYLSLAVARWRSPNQKLPCEHGDSCLARLASASPDIPGKPLLVLGIDGADELLKSDKFSALDELIKLSDRFRQDTLSGSPRLCLILTCRSADALRDLIGGSVLNGATEMKVKGYLLDDIDSMLRFYGCTAAANAIQSHMALDQGNFGNPLQPERRTLPAHLQWLCYPFAAHMLAELPESTQIAAIRLEKLALDTLAKKIVDQYAQRAFQRDYSISKALWCRMLASVADITVGINSPYLISEHWNTPIGQIGRSPQTAESAFDEAESFGLISKTGRRGGEWKWNLPFVAQYLANLPSHGH